VDEARNLVGSSEPEHRRAIKKFEQVVAEMPEQDVELPYRPLLAPRQLGAQSTRHEMGANAGGG
jgi:hypothetical protein